MDKKNSNQQNENDDLAWGDEKLEVERVYKSASLDEEWTFRSRSLQTSVQPSYKIHPNVQPSKGSETLSRPEISVPPEEKPIEVKERPKELISTAPISINKDVTIRKIDKFVSGPNSIVLTIPKEHIKGKTETCEEYIRKTVEDIYRSFQKLAPFLTFQPNTRHLECNGSYSYGYTVCYFDAQVWKVDPQISKSPTPDRHYIYEFRRKSLDGRNAFEKLLSGVASWLLADGKAKMYCSGLNIYPQVDPLQMLENQPFFNFPKPTHARQELDDLRLVTLDEDVVSNWADKIAQRSYPSCEELLRILAQCSKDMTNLQIMADEEKLLKVLCRELRIGASPSICNNCLIIVKSILQLKDVDSTQCLIKYGLLEATTKSLLTQSGCVPNTANKNLRHSLIMKPVRSAAIGRATLEVLKTLLQNSKIELPEGEVVLQMLEQNLDGKLKDTENSRLLREVTKKLKDVNSGGVTVSV